MVAIPQPDSGLQWEVGLYPAYIESGEIVENTWPGREGQLRVKWVIGVYSGYAVPNGPDPERNEIWYYTGVSMSKHPKATLPPFARAVRPDLNLDDPNFVPDTDLFTNRWCRVLLGLNEEKGRNTIEKVLPKEEIKRAPAPAVKTAPAVAAHVPPPRFPASAVRPTAPQQAKADRIAEAAQQTADIEEDGLPF